MSYETLTTSQEIKDRWVVDRDLAAAHEPADDGRIVLAASETWTERGRDEPRGDTTYLALSLAEVRALHAYLGRYL